MSAELLQVVSDFGFPALVCLGLGWFIVWIMKSHKDERAIDRAERKEIADASLVSTKELTTAITQLQMKGNNR